MFSAFMLSTIFTTLVQQIMPRFVIQRSLYEVREQPSKAYSWKAFLLANVIVEIPWQILLSVLVFVSYYYPIGFWQYADPQFNERGGLMFLYILEFFLFTSTFAQMVVAPLPVSSFDLFREVLSDNILLTAWFRTRQQPVQLQRSCSHSRSPSMASFRLRTPFQASGYSCIACRLSHILSPAYSR